MTAELKQAIEVLKVYRQGNIAVSHVNFIAAIDTVLSSINSGNKTGLDDRLQEKSIEVSDSQEGLSNKKDRIYTDKDMEEFAEWCSFEYEFNPFFNKWRKSEQILKHFVDNIDNTPTTIQLRELWERERMAK